MLEGYSPGGGLRRGGATVRLLRGRGEGCRRGEMELEEEGTLGRNNGKHYKAMTLSPYSSPY